MPFSGHKGGNGGSRREAAEPLRSQCQHDGDLGKLLSPERPLCRQAAGRERLAASNCLAPTLTQRYRHDRQPAGAQGCRRSEAIGARGATFRYLPKYSPDLNRSRCLSANSRPICARPPSGPCRRICRFAATLTAREASNYFRHAGFARNPPESALLAVTNATHHPL